MDFIFTNIYCTVINSFYVLFVENILLKDIKMLEPVINSSYCLTISWRTFKCIYVLMDFYYFAFVHYILITI